MIYTVTDHLIDKEQVISEIYKKLIDILMNLDNLRLNQRRIAFI